MAHKNNKRERVLASIKKNGFIFDKDWVEKLCEIGHVIIWNRGYPMIEKTILGKKKKIRVHRMIANCPAGLHVDHINRKREDNRAKNLRCIPPAENRRNLSKYKVYNYEPPKERHCPLCKSVISKPR